MYKKRRRSICVFLSLLFVFFALCGVLSSCGSGANGELESGDEPGAEETSRQGSGMLNPDETRPQYNENGLPFTILAQTPASRLTKTDDSTYLFYTVNNRSAGRISGQTKQRVTSQAYQSSKVTAIANLGYRFICWNDGSTEPVRQKDTTSSGTDAEFFAIFDYDFKELPVLHIETETGKDVESKTTYIGGHVSVYNTKSSFLRKGLEMQIRGRGNNTWTYEKKSYRMKLTEKDKLLGLGNGKHKTWVLLANMCDQSLLRNQTGLYLSRSLSGLDFAPDACSVEVYLNGEYRGVYLLAEQIQVDDDRVNVSEEVEKGVDIGYLVQMSVYSDPNAQGYITPDGWAYEVKSDLSANASVRESQKKYIKDYLESCWAAIKSGNREEIEKRIDIRSAVDAYIAEEIMKNLDMGWDSFYFHKDVGGKLVFGPIWDFDLTFGNGNETCQYYTDLYCAIYRQASDGNTKLSNYWFYGLMTCPWFRDLVSERYDECKETVFDGLDDYVLENGKAGYEAYCRNFDKWKIFGQRMNRETELITSLKTYKEHYTYLAEWIRNRVDWLGECYESEDFIQGTFIQYGYMISSLVPPIRPDSITVGNERTKTVMKDLTGLNSGIDSYQASTAGIEGEEISCAYDGNGGTKYCASIPGLLTLRIFFDRRVTLKELVFLTAPDTAKYPGRNPGGTWTVYGTNDDNVGNREWVELGTISASGCIGSVNSAYYAVPTGLNEAYKYYKIDIPHNGLIQFAEILCYGNE